MKAIFLLDVTDEANKVVQANARAIEVTQIQIGLRQLGPNETWLTAPHPDGDPAHFQKLVAFPAGLKKDATNAEEFKTEVQNAVAAYLRSQGANGNIAVAAADLSTFVSDTATKLMSPPPAAPEPEAATPKTKKVKKGKGKGR
jgi:hypothetical protein